MDRATVEVYEHRAKEWRDSRHPQQQARAEQFAARLDALGAPGPVVDLGCGPGWYFEALGGSRGRTVVALDAARAMLEMTRDEATGAAPVQADLASLPFGRRTLAGAWAVRSYVHLARVQLPMALADLHRALRIGAPFELQVFGGDLEFGSSPGDRFAGRSYARWPEDLLVAVVTGAGFVVDGLERVEPGAGDPILIVSATRARTLADTVGPNMGLLVAGLNPSVYSADVGTAFARPGNRFWPAAVAAGLVTHERDPLDALTAHGVGMTDVVKRATPRADGLTSAEYRTGMARLERLVGWLAPRAICFVGLAGWRAAMARDAVAGWQPRRLAGVPVYVMPSTSGVNGHSSLADLTDHLRIAARGPTSAL